MTNIRRLFVCLPPASVDGQFPWRLQLRCGRPHLSGVHGQRSVVGRAARHHLRGRAQELPGQVCTTRGGVCVHANAAVNDGVQIVRS